MQLLYYHNKDEMFWIYANLWYFLNVKYTSLEHQIRVCIFPHCDFQPLILQAIKKYQLLLQLNLHIKQLWMDRNSKEINLA